MYLWYNSKGYILAFSTLRIFKNQLFINSFNDFNNLKKTLINEKLLKLLRLLEIIILIKNYY